MATMFHIGSVSPRRQVSSVNPIENFEIMQFQCSLRGTLLRFPSEMSIMQSSLWGRLKVLHRQLLEECVLLRILF